ncbi:MAG: solute carrier family 23 protein [Eubacteriales bacterium]|nr:solute carrier family 23 protein [Eubacteriales bacterium]
MSGNEVESKGAPDGDGARESEMERYAECGARMPLVMGISIAFIALLSSITAAKGYGAAVGAVLIGGVVEAVLGLCAKYWQPFVNHVVAGTVVTSIGFSLLKVGASSFGGGSGAKDFGSPEIYCWGPFLWLSAWLSRSWRRMT